MTKEVLKLALEALEDACGECCNSEYNPCFQRKAITAIKKALAQPEQCQCPNCRVTLHASDCAVHNEPAYPKGACNCGAQPEQEPVAYDKTEMNCFVQDLYDKKMLEGKHGHYETMFHVVHQAIKIKDSGLVRCTHPVKDLEDIDINITWNENSMRDFGKDELNFARAILRKAQEK